MTREEIYTALFNLTSSITWGSPARTFKERSRRVKLFSDVPKTQQPALYQAEHAEVSTQVSNLPYKRTFAASWIVYQAVGSDPKAVPAIENNLILDALYAAIAPVPADRGHPQRNTLGGLVYHCFIDGEIFKDPGDIDNQGMMVIPIKLLVP